MNFSIQLMSMTARIWITWYISKDKGNRLTLMTSNCCWRSLHPWRPFGILSCKTFVKNNKLIFFIHRMDNWPKRIKKRKTGQRMSSSTFPTHWPWRLSFPWLKCKKLKFKVLLVLNIEKYKNIKKFKPSIV